MAERVEGWNCSAFAKFATPGYGDGRANADKYAYQPEPFVSDHAAPIIARLNAPKAP
jgi:hypothetical protein